MKCLTSYRINLAIVGFIVVLVIINCERASADYILGEPDNLGSPLNSTSHDLTPSITSDGLEVYFWSDRSGGRGSWDLWSSARASLDDQWLPAINLGSGINTSGIEALPCISADGLELYFSRGVESRGELMVSKRNNRMATWGTAQNLGSVVNSSVRDDSPVISNDGLELFFISTRPGGRGNADIWVTKRTATTNSWSNPTNLSVVNTSSYEQWVNLSNDGLTLLFQSTRSGGQYGGIYMSSRKSKDDPWTSPVYLGLPMNGSVYTLLSGISADGTMLYLSDHINYSPRAGGKGKADMWQVPIIPIIDFNGDGIVDSEDMCLMVDNWHTDETLYDIAPSPFGDGRVDVQDLIMLSEHLFEDYRLMAHWKLDELDGDIAYDSAGNNYGNLNGNPSWQPVGGLYDGALELNGTDDYVSTSFVLNPGNKSFSVFAWIKGGTPGQVIISQENTTSGRTFIPGSTWLGINPSDGKLMTGFSDMYFGALVSEMVITDGQWHHVGFVYDIDSLHRRLYVDGVLVAEDTTVVSGMPSEGGLFIGASSDLDAAGFFRGLIDDVCVYDVALSSEEIMALAE